MQRIETHKKKSPAIFREIFICLFLVIMTISVYWQIRHFDFVNYDDTEYVVENSHVRNGITLESIAWAFTTVHASNWHPLTWLSHMLDCQLYGMNPEGHHLTNLFFHIANILLLFFVFRKMTGSLWQSAFIAALFAIHPLNVESVAWVAERKNVLSTFFWLWTMWCYIRYVFRPDVYKYLLVVLSFAFGLMSKPMLVTLPCLFLLLDFWPLCRFRFQGSGYAFKTQQELKILYLVLEKIPLFFLAVISIFVTIYAQKQVGALGSLNVFPFNVRMANALISYVSYIGKMIYPFKLAVLYPYSKIFPWWKITGAALILASISFAAIAMIKKRPYFTTGWLWYLGTLIPVIGLVQVGSQSMADRYTYIPLIGLFIMVAWGAPELLTKLRYKKVATVSIASALIIFFMTVTWRQIGYWKNSNTLFEHALNVTSNNYLIHYNLGNLLKSQGRTGEAMQHYLQALRIKPDFEKAHNNLGSLLLYQGRIDEAIKQYLQALKIKPDYVDAHTNLGIALFRRGDIDGAISCFRESAKLNPSDKNVQNILKNALTHKNGFIQH